MAIFKVTKTEAYYIEANTESEAKDIVSELDNGSASKVSLEVEETN